MALSVLAGPRLDRLPICRFHYRILALVGSGLFLDSFDIYLQGPVLAELVRANWSTTAGNARFLSLTFLGLLIGTLLSGPVGDRWGRRKTYQFNLLLFGLASLGASLAPSWEVLLGCRFIMGIGLGGEVIISYGTLAEFVPAQSRGAWQAKLAFLSNAGIPTSALASLAVIPALGWRPLFGAVGVLAILIWTIRKQMPESPRWYESRGFHQQAEVELAAIESEVQRAIKRPLPPVTHSSGALLAPAPVSVTTLFRGNLRRRTIVAMLAMICMNVAVYTLTAWLPTMLVTNGVPIEKSLLFTALMQMGSLPGAPAGAWVVDRLGRRLGIVLMSVAASATSVFVAFTTQSFLLVGSGFALVVLLYGLVAATFAIYVPEVFPTRVRMTGSSISNASGRIANVVAPHGVARLLTSFGSSAVYLSIAGVLLLQAIVIAALAEETRRKSLEEIEEGI